MNQTQSTRLIMFFLTSLLIGIMSCGGTRVYENSRWKVTIYSAGYEAAYQYNAYPPPSYTPVARSMPGFVVKMEIEYIGPSAAARAPEVTLKSASGADSIKYKYSRWTNLITDQSDKTQGIGKIGNNPKTGKKSPARVEFVFPLKDNKSDYLLLIDDLEPIKL